MHAVKLNRKKMPRHPGILFWLHVSVGLGSQCDNIIRLVWSGKEPPIFHQYTLDPPEIYSKFVSFYQGNGRPPFKEAYLVHNTPANVFDSISGQCFGLALTSELLILEAELFLTKGPFQFAERFMQTWNSFISMDEESKREQSMVWPIELAVNRFNQARSRWESRLDLSDKLSVSFVICHCKEPLDDIIGNLSGIPTQSKLFVYEKCGQNVAALLASMFGNIFRGGITVIPQPDGPVRGDECTGYLDYIVKNYDSLSDYTVFLQGDADHHLFLSYLSTTLEGIKAGQYDVPFLHLNFHRHYQTTTPCMRDVERVIFNLTNPVEPLPLIGTYCCAQFIVSRPRIRARDQKFYSDALKLVDGSVADLCSPDPPRRSSHCYVLEYLWHVVFGEPRDLPHKPDDQRLPLLLRMKYGNENRKTRWDDVPLSRTLPSILNRTVDTC
jgi:hypothetical protein